MVARLVLPAYAGMIRRGVRPENRVGGAPRVCGDDPVTGFIADHIVPCSPRMRG